MKNMMQSWRRLLSTGCLLADSEKEKLIEKMSNLLKENGSLILLWDFPPDPNDDVLDRMAGALNMPKPFHSGNGSAGVHFERMQERVLDPVEASPFFTGFKSTEHLIEERILIESYMNFLKTMSNYINMEEEEQRRFFDTVSKTLREECGDVIVTSRISMLNVISKSKSS